MAYRHDNDLNFLGQLKSADLNDLVYCITHDKDGSARLTEELTMNDLYKANHPEHQKYWQLIAAEIQCFGAIRLQLYYEAERVLFTKKSSQTYATK